MTRKTLMTVAILIVMLVSLFGTAAAQTGDGPTTTPTPAPTTGSTPAPATGTTTGTKFFTHPVVTLLSKYFDRDTEATTPATSTNPGAPATTETPAVVSGTPTAGGETPTDATPTTGEEELGIIGQQIAAYHEDGMGFGVLVKIYAMAEAAKKACPPTTTTGDTTGTTGTDGAATGGTTDAGSTTADGSTTAATCTPVTADELVAQFKGGAGMGQLFKEYGKPNLLGVGHVKKELKKQAEQEDPTVVTSPEPTTDDGTTVDQPGSGKDKDKDKDQGKKDQSNKGKQDKSKGNNGQSKDKGKNK